LTKSLDNIALFCTSEPIVIQRALPFTWVCRCIVIVSWLWFAGCHPWSCSWPTICTFNQQSITKRIAACNT